ncbi:DUF481 domain-containing protein [Bacteroidota bacterium]
MRRLSAILISFLLLAAVPTDASGQKTDVIQMPNGDRTTGEIKLLERGRLSYSVDNMSRLSINWSQVVLISSAHFFNFELSNSKRYFGRIEEGEELGHMVIVSDTGRVYVRLKDVVRIEPLYSSFWGRMKGSSMDIGLDFTRANLQRLWNLQTKILYKTRKWSLTFDADSYVNLQEDRDPSNRNSASLTPQRMLGKGYTAYSIVKAEANDELNLELRATLVAGASRFLHRSNRSNLQTRLGLAFTEEKFGGSELTANGEGLVAADFSVFKFIVPKIDFKIDLFVYPSISNWGRVRGNSNASIQWEPITDFRIGLNGYLVFDNRPATETSSNLDYGVFSSVGVIL